MAKRSEPKPANAEDNSQTGKIAIVALAALGLAIKSRVARSKADAKPFVTRLPTATNSTPGASSSVDKSPSGRALRSPLRPRDSSTRDHAAEGLALIELEARGVAVSVSPFGATIVSLRAARRGDADEKDDVVLGFDDCESYDEVEGRPYFGAVCGRVANRIARGEFAVGRRTHALAKNNGENTLHGGTSGWDRKRWTVEDQTRSSVTLSYVSVDGEEGFPANVKMYVVYSVVGFGERVELECDEDAGEVKLCVRNCAELTTKMTATADAMTPISTVQHTYFNLNGHACGEDCSSHVVEMPNCDRYVPVNEDTLIPTGEGLRKVDGTAFDLRSPTPMFEKSSEGYDNTFVIAGADATRPTSELPRAAPRLAARVTCEDAGRVLEVLTDAPGVHLYTGNFLSENMVGKKKERARYRKHGGFCLETGWFPDAVNQHSKIGASYPSVMVNRGDTYSHTLTYRLSNI